MKKNKARILWLSAITFLIFAASTTILVIYKSSESSSPPQITTNFIDLNTVEKISKYRSCQGHIVIPQDESETMRNMKHYVVLKPQYYGGNKVAVYAPISGDVSVRSETEKGLEGEVWLGQRGSDWQVSIQHLVISQDIRDKQKVTAGQTLGYVANRGIDIVYGIGAKTEKVIDGYASPYLALDSIFNHMADEVFDKYRARGIETRDSLVYSKDFRDQNPCKYREGSNEGGLNDAQHPEDWVMLN